MNLVCTDCESAIAFMWAKGGTGSAVRDTGPSGH